MSFLLVAGIANAQKVGKSQQIAIAKILKPGLTTVAVISSTFDDETITAWSRAGGNLGIKVVIGKIKVMMELSDVYKQLVKEKGAQVIILPDAGDKLMTGIGFEYLRESALSDLVGVFAPAESMVGDGALCCITMENGKLKAVVNQRIASAIGANIPTGQGESITYVVR